LKKSIYKSRFAGAASISLKQLPSMQTETSIAKKIIRILSYPDHTIQTESNASDDILMALYNMHKLSPTHAVITCPVKHGHFFYISENCSSVFGYSPEYMAEHFKSLSHYLSQIHPADLNQFLDCVNYFESFMRTESVEEYHKLRATFHYRFTNAQGRHIYLQDEKASLITAGGKTIHYSLVRNISDEILFTGVKIEVFSLEKGIRKLGEHKPSASGTKLSAREKDLVRLIKTGLTTKEIAWQLNISHNTVRNIKSRMFEKFRVNNTIELLNMTS
jgi:DNA-binding CsgD family transcriptional regulator